MVSVWRLETAGGQGIYVDSICSNMPPDLRCNSRATDNRPMPYNDQRLVASDEVHGYEKIEEWRFGFASVHAYMAWFNSKAIRKWFAEYRGRDGERVVLAQYKLEISGISFGDYQIKFDRDNSTLIATYRPDFV